MKNRIWFLIAGVIGLVVVGWVGWFLASPLFIDNVVDEEFPVELPSTTELAQMPEEQRQEIEVMEAAQMPEEGMADTMPGSVAEAQPVLLGQGEFVDADSFHQGSGMATLYQLPDGGHILRFENFEVTNGPDLHVILSGHPAPANSSELMQNHLDLGSLKGNIGSQNYEIPAGTDVSQFKSVVIYCQPFGVVFSTATLVSS